MKKLSNSAGSGFAQTFLINNIIPKNSFRFVIGFQNVVSFNKTKILQLFRHFCEAYWTEWEDTSPCSKSCETGQKNQKRYCQRGNKKVANSECQGDTRNTKQENCNFQRCRKSESFIQFHSNQTLMF